jgi:hypothetical protein
MFHPKNACKYEQHKIPQQWNSRPSGSKRLAETAAIDTKTSEHRTRQSESENQQQERYHQQRSALKPLQE